MVIDNIYIIIMYEIYKIRQGQYAVTIRMMVEK